MKKKELSTAMKKKLKEHSIHHSVKHMNQMKKDIMNGASFTVAHKTAQKKVGK
jgi:hypothetical protein|tara:strand:- start:1624 stop:1782 length:159 start_codon:yes stop_codon:yes gene_type:complete